MDLLLESTPQYALKLIEGRLHSQQNSQLLHAKTYAKIFYGTNRWETDASKNAGLRPKWNELHIFKPEDECDSIVISLNYKSYIFMEKEIGKCTVSIAKYSKMGTEWIRIKNHNGQSVGAILICFEADYQEGQDVGRVPTEGSVLGFFTTNSSNVSIDQRDLYQRKLNEVEMERDELQVREPENEEEESKRNRVRNVRQVHKQHSRSGAGDEIQPEESTDSLRLLEPGYDSSELQDLERIREDLREERNRILRQETTVKIMFQRLQEERSKLNDEKTKMKDKKDGLSSKEKSLVSDKKTVQQDRERLTQAKEEFQKTKETVERDFLKIKIEKLKQKTQLKIILETQKGVQERSRQLLRQKRELLEQDRRLELKAKEIREKRRHDAEVLTPRSRASRMRNHYSENFPRETRCLGYDSEQSTIRKEWNEISVLEAENRERSMKLEQEWTHIQAIREVLYVKQQDLYSGHDFHQQELRKYHEEKKKMEAEREEFTEMKDQYTRKIEEFEEKRRNINTMILAKAEELWANKLQKFNEQSSHLLSSPSKGTPQELLAANASYYRNSAESFDGPTSMNLVAHSQSVYEYGSSVQSRGLTNRIAERSILRAQMARDPTGAGGLESKRLKERVLTEGDLKSHDFSQLSGDTSSLSQEVTSFVAGSNPTAGVADGGKGKLDRLHTTVINHSVSSNGSALKPYAEADRGISGADDDESDIDKEEENGPNVNENGEEDSELTAKILSRKLYNKSDDSQISPVGKTPTESTTVIKKRVSDYSSDDGFNLVNREDTKPDSEEGYSIQFQKLQKRLSNTEDVDECSDQEVKRSFKVKGFPSTSDIDQNVSKNINISRLEDELEDQFDKSYERSRSNLSHLTSDHQIVDSDFPSYIKVQGSNGKIDEEVGMDTSEFGIVDKTTKQVSEEKECSFALKAAQVAKRNMPKEEEKAGRPLRGSLGRLGRGSIKTKKITEASPITSKKEFDKKLIFKGKRMPFTEESTHREGRGSHYGYSTLEYHHNINEEITDLVTATTASSSSTYGIRAWDEKLKK